MKEKKNILLHLYGDPDAEGELRSLLKDPELQHEHKTLSEAKFRLDHMKRSRPDTAVIDRIMMEASKAAAAPAVGRRRGDRPAVWRSRSLRRVLIPAVSMAAVIVVSVGIGWFGFLDEWTRAERPELAAQDQTVDAESLFRTTPINPDVIAPTPVQATDPLLTWDDAESLRNLYRRIETIRPEHPLDWGERTVPLESLPGGSGSSRLRQAGVQK